MTGANALIDGLISNWMLDPGAFDLARVGEQAIDAKVIAGFLAPLLYLFQALNVLAIAVLALSGVDAAAAATQAKAVIEFETRLAKASMDKVALRDPGNYSSIVSCLSAARENTKRMESTIATWQEHERDKDAEVAAAQADTREACAALVAIGKAAGIELPFGSTFCAETARLVTERIAALVAALDEAAGIIANSAGVDEATVARLTALAHPTEGDPAP